MELWSTDPLDLEEPDPHECREEAGEQHDALEDEGDAVHYQQRLPAVPTEDRSRGLGAGGREDPWLVVEEEEADGDDLLEVIPIDDTTLSLAPEGTRPGLTGHAHISHGDSAVACAQWALARTAGLAREYTQRQPARDRAGKGRRRGFYHDLLAGFWCAGHLHNAKVILLTAVAWWLLMLPPQIGYLVAGTQAAFWLAVATAPLSLLLLLYVINFWWSVARLTAGGDDLIPWIQDEWSLWHDAVVPLGWLVAVSLGCTFTGVPVALAIDASNGPLLATTAIIGWVIWPAALATIIAGRPLRDLLPDRLLLTIVRSGPAYAAACMVLLLNLGGWLAFLWTWRYWALLPVLGMAVNLYFGYVLFRTLGLLIGYFYYRRSD